MRQLTGNLQTAIDHVNMKEYDMAIKSIEFVINLEPSFVDAQIVYALSLMGVGKFDDAKSAIDKVLSLDPSHNFGLKIHKKLGKQYKLDQRSST